MSPDGGGTKYVKQKVHLSHKHTVTFQKGPYLSNVTKLYFRPFHAVQYNINSKKKLIDVTS